MRKFEFKEAVVSEARRISYEKRDHIVIITINRPEKLNAMDPLANQQLTEAWLIWHQHRRASNPGAGAGAWAQVWMGYARI